MDCYLKNAVARRNASRQTEQQPEPGSKVFILSGASETHRARVSSWRTRRVVRSDPMRKQRRHLMGARGTELCYAFEALRRGAISPRLSARQRAAEISPPVPEQRNPSHTGMETVGPANKPREPNHNNLGTSVHRGQRRKKHRLKARVCPQSPVLLITTPLNEVTLSLCWCL
jgi:hypothetical protein